MLGFVLKFLNTADLLRRKSACEGCFTGQSVYSVISLGYGMSFGQLVHPQESLKVDRRTRTHSGPFMLIESARMMAPLF